MDKENVSRKIIRVIPDKLFSELWKKASDSEDETQFVREELRKINYKYNIPLDHYMDMLHSIYFLSHIPIREIVLKSGYSKASFGYKFCIPIRTLENWCDESRPCPPYVRLMLLREFKMFTLTHHIYTESEVPAFVKRKPRKNNKEINKVALSVSKKEEYADSLAASELAENVGRITVSDIAEVGENTVSKPTSDDDRLDEIDAFLDSLPTISKHQYDDFKQWEKEHIKTSGEAQDILQRTDYLKKLFGEE